MSQLSSRRLFGIADFSYLAVGCVMVIVLRATGISQHALSTAGSALLLGAIVAVIVFCAFGVLRQAERLAHLLGDPYGSRALTLSVVLIEVSLIAAVMLGKGEHATIARDSVMAVSMIILNLVIGISLLAGGLRQGGMRLNRTGTSIYLVLLVVLLTCAFVLPNLVGEGGAYSEAQEVPVIILTLGLYIFFLAQQLGVQAEDFREVGERVVPQSSGISAPNAGHERSIRVLLLILTMLPIVLLSHLMATLLDDVLAALGAPSALGGEVIAMIVFLPESLTSIRAGLAGEAQRVVNLCLGALVSTVGLPVPVVLIVGMLTGQTVVLAESPANAMLLGVTLLLSAVTFGARRVTAVHGAAHVVLFTGYIMVLFS